MGEVVEIYILFPSVVADRWAVGPVLKLAKSENKYQPPIIGKLQTNVRLRHPPMYTGV